MAVLLFMLSPHCILKWFFGSGWDVAGEYVKVLAIMFGLRFVVSALTPGIIIVRKQFWELLFQMLFICSSVIIYVITRNNAYDVQQYLTLISGAYSIIYILYYCLLLYYSVRKTGSTEEK
jgi:hypothetical protein